MTDTNEPNPYRSPTANSDPRSDDPQEKPEGLTGKLVVLATFDSVVEAHLFKQELENNGIKAAIANETTGAVFGFTLAGQSSAFWIEVLVMDADSERGLEVKTAWNQKDRTLETSEITEWTCKCGETVDEGFAVCWSCGTDHETGST